MTTPYTPQTIPVGLGSSRDHAPTDCDAQQRPVRMDRALALYKASPDQSPQALSDSLAGDIFTVMAEHFASVYASARGHTIDPIYVKALRNDCLCTLAALLEANPAADSDGAKP